MIAFPMAGSNGCCILDYGVADYNAENYLGAHILVSPSRQMGAAGWSYIPQ